MLSIIPLLIFGTSSDFIMVMLISGSAAYLVVYIIAHLNVIILRFKYPAFKRPFKTPLYPLPQIIGIAGMIYALIRNAPTHDMMVKVYINSGVLVGALAIYAFFRVRFIMKRGLFRAEPIQQAILD